ncbi:AAA family ATPase [Dactylosporangium sp. CA-233914]|uniref:helix-turn-helix transcriptional regulator n=1 Tax=Dactylosporangium sp. CA-233914 TaxID=3239934 RepID=UPI003D927E3B
MQSAAGTRRQGWDPNLFPRYPEWGRTQPCRCAADPGRGDRTRERAIHPDVGGSPTVASATDDPASGSGLLERHGELAELRAAVDGARRRAGVVAVIQGPPGAGKTALLAAAAVTARAAGVGVLASRGRELERTVALGVVTDLLAPAVAAVPPAQRARLFDGLAAPAAALLLRPAEEPAPPGDAALVGLCWVAAHLAGWNVRPEPGRPLLLTVDDAHWADPLSLRFLAMLADRADRLALSLVVTAGDGEPDEPPALRHLVAHPRARRLTLAPLSAAAVDRLTTATFPGSDPSLAAAVAHVSGGNPFFVDQVLHALRTAGTTPTAATAANLVPAAVLHAVLTRLTRLPDPAIRLATSLAVLGDDTPIGLARAHAGLPLTTAEDAADLLAAAQLLRPGNPLAFRHPLIGAAVHAHLPRFARARAHRRAADLLAADAGSIDKAAGHLLLTEPAQDPAAVRVLSAAARRALRRGDPAGAVLLLRRALDEPPPGERARHLMDLAAAQVTAGDANADGLLTQALGLLGSAEVHARAEALSGLARIHHAQGDLARAATAAGQALDLLDPRDPAWQDVLADFLAVATFHPPLRAAAEQRLAPVLHDARAGRPPRRARLLAHVTLRLALAGDPPATVGALAARALADDPFVDPADHGTLFGLVAHALVIAGECATAESAADATLAAARRRGDYLALRSGAFHRSLAHLAQGSLTAALADLQVAQGTPDAGWRGAAGWLTALAVDIHLDLGDRDAARRALRDGGEVAPDTMEAALLGLARARLALGDHDPAAAVAGAQAVGAGLWRGFGIDHPGLLPWRTTAALAAHRLGDHRQAVRLARDAHERAGQIGVAVAVGSALRIMGVVAGPGPDATLLAEAVETLRGTGAALEHARALVDLGTALRRQGRLEAGRGALRDGLALADRLHAVPLAERARTELLAAGGRPRRTAVTGVNALTPAEQRVALLALHGDGNATIAQTLFVTTKTVETHLSRAYRKLGITGRKELGKAFGSGP